MKNLYFTLLLLIATTTNSLWAQDFTSLKGLTFEDSTACAKAQVQVLECCNYLISKPINKTTELNSLYASDFVREWLMKTPNYEFTIQENLFKAIGEDVQLSSRYFAFLAKYAIESNFVISNSDLQYKAINGLLGYCILKKNNVVINKKLQKFIDAKDENTLKELLEK